MKPTLWESVADEHKKAAYEAEQYLCDVVNLWRSICFWFRTGMATPEFILYKFKRELLRVHGWHDIEPAELAWIAILAINGFPEPYRQEYDALAILLNKRNLFGGKE